LNLILDLKVVIKASCFVGHPEILNFMFGLTAGGYFCILKVSETLDSLFAEAAYDKRFRKT